MQLQPMPLNPEPPAGSHKKIIYLVRHAEAEHNVKEREAIRAAVAKGETNKQQHDRARRAVLSQDPSLKDAPLSKDGTEQARTSGKKLGALYHHQQQRQRHTPPPPTSHNSPSSSPGSTTSSTVRRQRRSNNNKSPFRRPDIVLVSPLRRALETATELFLHSQHGDDEEDPPVFLAIEALREKRTGLACDERSSVAELRAAFPHVDFSDVERGYPAVPMGEDNEAVRARAAEFLDTRLASVPGQHLAMVSHKGWLREQRKIIKSRVESGLLRANFDVNEWDTTLFGNAEARVAAFRWQDGDLTSVVSRSVDNAMLASAAMMGDGFEFALGPPSSGFSMFLADRTTKVHFISLAEGRHTVAIRGAAAAAATNDDADRAPQDHTEDYSSSSAEQAEALLVRKEGQLASDHPLFDARLTKTGAAQAVGLRKILANRPSGGRPFTAFDLVVVSPLTRACETAQLVFCQSPGTYGGTEIPPPRILVKEECRERFGRYVCDGRRPVRELAEEFPTFDFSEMTSDEDEWHADDRRERGVELRERALRLLGWLSARPERCVAVVTHSEFLRHLFGQFGDTLHEDDRGLLQRTGKNCELRSVVLCSHGAVEREETDAPASTVRVPSCSSLSSLVSL